ncbi:MAG: SDR family NAD(P)-dependent oxidoreductase [Gammaproteobacteria bacterium]
MQKTILITGCSSGIGLTAAQLLQKRGYRVFATTRKEADVEKLKAQGLESLRLDVDDSDSIRTALDEILQRTGGTLDALFNNAGFGLPGAVEDLTRDMIRHQFETNVFGAIELTNLVLPVMRKQGHGRIIMNTSILGTVAFPYYGAYNASKFALEGFTNTLRIELRGTPIFVSIIAPGPITSRFRDNALKNYHETLENKPSEHLENYKKLEKNYSGPPSKSEQKITLGPDAVTEKLILALESRKPKAHYYVTVPAHMFAFLRRILPDSALDWAISKAAGAEKK